MEDQVSAHDDESYRMEILTIEQKRVELLGDIKIMRSFLMNQYGGHPEVKAALIEKYAPKGAQ